MTMKLTIKSPRRMALAQDRTDQTTRPRPDSAWSSVELAKWPTFEAAAPRQLKNALKST